MTPGETRPKSRLQALSAEALTRGGDVPAMAFKGRWWTREDVRRVGQSVVELIAASGAHPQAPVVFIARNHPAAFASLLGLLSTGRTVRMVYPFQAPAAVAGNIERLKPAVVVAAERDFAPEVQAQIRKQGAAAIVIGDMQAEALAGFERSTAEPDPALPEEPQIEILTSGTTGPPKQFAVSHEMLAKHFLGASNMMYQDMADPAQAPPVLLFFPLGNISGIYSSLPALLNGVRMVILERFNVPEWRDFVVTYRPVNGGLPPAGVQMVLDADVPKEDLAGIRFVGTGAAPLDPTVQRAFETRYGIPILLSYGATEFGGPVAAMTPELHAEWGERKFGSVGRAFYGAQLRVVDPETGAPLPAGEEGVLEVISPRIGPDWIRTSDIAVLDEDGFLFHRGRADGAIMRGGFKVLPETIERALLLHPAVSAAAVVALPDHRLGQVPGAAVMLKPDAPDVTAQDLETHLRAHVLATHIPVTWRFVDELPRTPSMKVDRPALVRLLQAEADQPRP